MPKIDFSNLRSEARATIQQVIIDEGTDDIQALKTAINAAYPFDKHSYWLDRIWTHEVNHKLTIIGRRQRKALAHTRLRDYWTA
jgi:hypothetical protein